MHTGRNGLGQSQSERGDEVNGSQLGRYNEIASSATDDGRYLQRVCEVHSEIGASGGSKDETRYGRARGETTGCEVGGENDLTRLQVRWYDTTTNFYRAIRDRLDYQLRLTR